MRKHYITLLSLLVCHALNPIEGSSVEKPSKNSKTNFFANPVATNDYASTPVNTPVSFNVVNGSASIFGVADSDSDGNLNIASVDINTSSSGRQTTNTTSAGSWSVDDSGVVTFTPTATFNGNATLNYRISDLTGGVSNQATILVSVTSWPNLQPNSDPFTLFTDHQRVKLYSWSDPMFSYSYNTGGGQTLVGPNQTVVGNIKFRLLPPNGYTVGGGTKYPLIVFLHGSGESSPDAPAYVNNEHQLLHGGQTHINAVRNNPVKFNGFLFYPQIQRTNNGGDNYWSPNWREAVRRVLEVLIQNYDVDRERIYIHGLSGGGEATVLLMSDFPEYFAAGHPMSAADDVLTVGPVINGIGYLPNYKHIPMRTSQGGQDGAPSPAQGNKFVNDIRTGIFGGNYMGGNVEYHYYPNLGHNTWGDEYNRPDFFSWFLSHKKNKPWVMNGQTSFCPGEPINTKIGFSASKAAAEYRPSGAYFYGKIKAYEWEKDGSPFGGNTNEITITATGSYRGRFLREGPTSGNGDDVWSDWSDPIIIDSNRGLSAAPTISTNGKSTVLPSLDGSAEVILYGTTNKAAYAWKRDASVISGATTSEYTASATGTYTLSTRDAAGSPFAANGVTAAEFRPQPLGCFSADSNPIVVTNANGTDVPAPPADFFAGATSPTSITLSWSDRSDPPKAETGFELYRSTISNSGYVLVTIVPPDTESYVNTGLSPNTTYYYRMRAVNNSGGSAYTPVAQATTSVDNIAPTSPVLAAGSTSRTVINLTWSGAFDAMGVTEYEVYQNGALIGTTSSTTFAVTSVVAFTQYYFTVKAKDAAGNVSPASNQIYAAAVNTGLFYSYYHTNGIPLTTEITTAGTLIKTGIIGTFDVSPANSNPGQRSDNFAFVFEGFINIPSSGNYTFYTTSDDGSQLFINNALVVNNDGPHGSQERSGVVNFPPGTYPQSVPIKVTYFENTGSNHVLTVSWLRPGSSKQTIPSSALRDNFTPPGGPSAPSNFRLSQNGSHNPNLTYNAVWLQWTDNSNNETGFQIYRLKSTNGSGTYQVVATVPANGTSTAYYNDLNLEPGTRYYYQIRSINAAGASSAVQFRVNGNSGNQYIETPNAPAAPNPPSGLSATAVSATQINLAWNGTAVTNETGFEIQKASVNSESSFITITTTAANVATYEDTQAPRNSTLFYRVRSRGNGGTASAWSNVTSASTTGFNSAPVITPVSPQSALVSSTTNINITVTDADLDPLNITFNFSGAVTPTSHQFTSNGYGQGVLSITYGAATGTSTVQIVATDGIVLTPITSSFNLELGSNLGPFLTVINVNGSNVLPLPASVPNQTVEEGRTLTLAITVNDNSGNTTLQTPLISWPAGLTFRTANWDAGAKRYTLTFNPTVGSAGIYDNIVVTFRDSNSPNGVLVQTFSLIVTPVDRYFSISMNLASDPAYYEGAPWNNSGFASNTPMTNLRDDQGNTVKNITFLSNGGFNNWSSGTSTLPNDPGAVFTKKVRDSHYRISGNYTDGKYVVFLNLNPALKYVVKVYGGVQGTGTLNTSYTVLGATQAGPPQEINVYNNTSVVRTFPEVSPTNNANREVAIKVLPGTGHPLSPTPYYINAVVLEGLYVDPNVAPAAPSALEATAPAHNQVNLTWADNSNNENGFRLYKATSSEGPWTTINIPTPNQLSYTDNAVNSTTTYYYRLASYNNIGESASTPIVIIRPPNGAPTIAPITNKTVRVNETLQVNFTATDPESSPLTFTLLNNPGFANLVDNGNGSGFINFAPTANQAGTYTITLRVADNQTASSQLSFQLQVIDTEYDQVVYINFVNTAASNAPLPWNNKTLSSPSSTNIKSDGEEESSITFTRSAGSWTAYDGGTTSGGVNTGNNSGIYPDNVIKSNWSSGLLDNNTDNTDDANRITLGGLDPDKRYNITIFGSRDQYLYANTVYSIINQTPIIAKSVNNMKNRDKVVRFSGVTPNAADAIVISVKRAISPYSATTNKDATINGLIIEEYSIGAVPRRPTNLAAKGWSKNSIKLTWYDNSADETGFEIFRAEDPAGPFTSITTTAANAESYVDGGLQQNKAYVYRIRAVKGGSQTAFTNDAIASTFDQVILVNVAFQGQGVAEAPWNNVTTGDFTTGTTLFENLNDISGSTPIDLYVTNSGPSGNIPGNVSEYFEDTNPVASSFTYPGEVQRSYYFFVPNDPPTELQLIGVDPTKAYDLMFYSHIWGQPWVNGEGVWITDYTVASQTQTLFNSLNITETANFYSVTPEPDGTLAFQIRANSDIANGAFVGDWSAMEIHSYTPLSTAFDLVAPTVPTGLIAFDVRDDSVALAWNPSEDNVGVAGYEVFQGSTLVATIFVAGPGIDTVAYITGLQPLTTYTFSVRAFDTKGNRSALSNGIQVTTDPFTGAVTVWYPAAASDISVLGNWGTNPDGSGSHPSSFTGFDNQHYTINKPVTLGSLLNIAGTNTRVIVQAGQTLTLNQTLNALVDTEGNAQVIVNTNMPPQFGTLSSASTISFTADPNTIPGASYGNLTLSGAGSEKNFSTGTYQVNGNLQIADAVELVGSTGNGTTLSIAGNLTISGTPVLPAENQLFSINFADVTPHAHTLSGNSASLRFSQLRVTNGTLSVVNSDATNKTITLGTTAGGGLIIDNGASVDLDNTSLVISGQGAINPNNETGTLAVDLNNITINSTGSQVSNLYFSPTDRTVRNITLNSSNSSQVNIRSLLNVRENVTINTGHLSSGGNIVLLSDETGTARIAPIGATASLLGNIEYQRYFDITGRIYRYVSAPLENTTVANWMDVFRVTGNFTGSDAPNSTTSLWVYNDDRVPSADYERFPPTSSSETFTVGRGYLMYIFEGDNANTLRLNGPIKQQNFTFPNLANGTTSGTDGWSLVGNPYASPIRWTNTGWTRGNIDPTMYIRENQKQGSATLASVKWYHAPTGANGASGTLDDPDGYDGVIAQGQSFWVKATAPSPSLVITESAKYNTLNAEFFRAESPSNMLDITMSNGTLFDKAVILFYPSAHDGVDNDLDALKVDNSFFNISSLSSDNANLVLNSRPESFCSTSIPLNVKSATQGSYTLKFRKLSSFTSPVVVTLEDKFTGNTTMITEGQAYPFDITSNTASFGSARFVLTIAKPELNTNVTLSATSSSQCGDGDVTVILNDTQSGARYDILRDGTVVGSAIGNGATLSLNIDKGLLVNGNNALSLRGGFDGCEQASFESTLNLTFTTKPVATLVDGVLISSHATGNQWLLNGNIIPGATNATFIPEQSGDYTVVTTGATCTLSSDPVTFAITGMEDPDRATFGLYPNPVKNKFTIKLPASVRESKRAEITLYNTAGVQVARFNKTNRKDGIELNGGDLSSGLYNIKVQADGQLLERRMIKE